VVTAHISRQGNKQDGVNVSSATVLCIEDNGPGIAMAEREKVFERFYRLNESQSDGCGLGLPIAREIAKSCGATISLLTPPSGQGLMVQVIFPD
jgi:signal transduction histidine kinase